MIDVPLGVRVNQGDGLLGSLIVDLLEDVLGEGSDESASVSVRNHGTAEKPKERDFSIGYDKNHSYNNAPARD